MRTIVIGLVFFLSSSVVIAKGIDLAHQTCKADSDCRIVIIGCACIHNSTCLGPNDKAGGLVSSVNKRFEKQYESLSKCSKDEIRQCSAAGACPTRGEWLPKCEHDKCDAFFKEK